MPTAFLFLAPDGCTLCSGCTLPAKAPATQPRWSLAKQRAAESTSPRAGTLSATGLRSRGGERRAGVLKGMVGYRCSGTLQSTSTERMGQSYYRAMLDAARPAACRPAFDLQTPPRSPDIFPPSPASFLGLPPPIIPPYWVSCPTTRSALAPATGRFQV